MKQDTYRMIATLERYGVSYTDAMALRRISMTLHRWNERECNGEIERDEITGKTYTVYGGDHYEGMPRQRTRCADRERGAQKRLAAIMARYPSLAAYEQTDPRGAALYIYRKADLDAFASRVYRPEQRGEANINNCYSSVGTAVYA